MCHANQQEYKIMLRTVQTLKISLVWKLRFLPGGGVSLIWGWGTGVLAEGTLGWTGGWVGKRGSWKGNAKRGDALGETGLEERVGGGGGGRLGDLRSDEEEADLR
jgi:hypothetical protein